MGIRTTTVESWKLSDVAAAISTCKIGSKTIEVPKFQRNLVWKDEQKTMFIDSIKNGFPVGSLLFYKLKNKDDTYSLIDGLQRSSTICDFINNPTKYFSIDDIDEKSLDALYKLFEIDGEKSDFYVDAREKIKALIIDEEINSSSLTLNVTKKLVSHYIDTNSADIIFSTAEIIDPCMKSFKDQFENISESEVPVLIFSGEEGDLPTVFERINSKGTTLGKYQIYAAVWAVKNYVLNVENEKIIDHVINKYENFISKGYTIQNYDKDLICESKQLSVFEYVLGLGKYLADKYEYLFKKEDDAEEISQVGFELLNACFGRQVKDIKTLNEELIKVKDINDLEKALISTIDDVSSILLPYVSFKGNSRNTITIFHADAQIVSIVGSTFRAKYDIEDLQNVKSTWKSKYALLKKYIPQHYVYDIISKYWFEGSQQKIFADLVENNRYLSPIPYEMWESKLDDWFINMNTRRERTNIASPKATERLFLNCVHLNTMSAFQQLSSDNFDIEHLATKDKLKKYIKRFDWDGLPISSIGNLCYLPEYDNRTKGSKTIYEDKKYIADLSKKGLSVADIEDKYTLTNESGLEWILHKDSGEQYTVNDYDLFLSKYSKFLENHFNEMKKRFYATLNIDVPKQ